MRSEFFDGLEDRRLLASFSASGTTLNITLDEASQLVAITSAGTSYSFVLSGGATNTWTGSATGASNSGATLTVDSTGLSTYDTFNIADGANGNGVTFNSSGTNTYADNFTITLDGNVAGDLPAVVTFNGATTFAGSNAIAIVTSRSVVFAAGSALKTTDGNLTLQANQQATASAFSGAGIDVNNATVESTGTGVVTVKGKAGGTTSSSGVLVRAGGSIKGGTATGDAGKLTVDGTGAAVTLNLCHGVTVSGANSTIGSNGANVGVTGTGGGIGTSSSCYGVYVASGGQITAGGTGSVTVEGAGGNNSAGASGNNYYGVIVSGSSCRITSSGGAVTVTGKAGGAGSSGYNCIGVYVISGGQISSGSGSAPVTVSGTGGGKSNTNHKGVLVSGTGVAITSGGGDVLVTGQGGGAGDSTSSSGVTVNSGGQISAGGMGTVTVQGTGGSNVSGTGSSNYGVDVQTSPSAITSSGGAVTVTGTGGGAVSSGATNHGVYLADGGQVTSAGATAAVTVTGTGGGASGGNNCGVSVENGTSPNFSRVASGGGNVVVTGAGGGKGTSISNIGILVSGGGQVTAGSTGTVTVQGTGGNNYQETNNPSPTGGSNYGVLVTGSPSVITSSGGAVSVTGTGGGAGGSGGGNQGVYLYNGGLVTSAGATATVTVTGTGGSASGDTNYGVFVSGGTSPNFSRVTSGGGQVRVTGTEGAGSSPLGVKLSSSGLLTTATNGGDLNVRANSLDLGSGTTISGGSASAVTITPRTSGVALDLGLATDSSGGPLALSAAEFQLLAGRTLLLGDTSSGAITLSQPLTASSGADLKLTSGSTAGVIPSATGTDLTITGKTLSFGTGTPLNIAINGATVDTGYQQLNVAGAVNLSGTALSLSGSKVPQGGEVYTIVSASSLSGTLTGLADGDALRFNGRTLLIHYTATSVTLTDPAPAVTTNPSNSTVNPGDPVTFTAAASGTPSPTVRWQVDTGSGFVDMDPAQTDPTLTFTPTVAQSGNQYRAVFTNTYGTATTTAAVLTVLQAPAITTQPISATVAPGDTARFTAEASGSPSPTVQWQVDTGSGWTDIAGATATTYSFTAGAGDNGSQYRAVFTNSVGTATSGAATLTTEVAPVITAQPVGGTYLPGTTTVLTAAATGTPTPQVQWQVNAGSGWSNVAGATSTSLGVSVTAGFASRYRAVFSNSAGTTVSDDVLVRATTAVTAQLTAVRSGLVLNRSTGLFEGTITVRNKGASLAALSLLLSGLTGGVVLTNATGSVTNGTPYLNFGPLAAGQSITLRLSFRKPAASTAVNYTPQFYLQA